MLKLAIVAMVLLAVPVIPAASEPLANKSQSPGQIEEEVDGGPIVLMEGQATGLVSTGPDGSLQFDASHGDAAGLNPNAKVTYGDPKDPVNLAAFTIRNTDSVPLELGIQYAANDPAPETENVRFLIFDDAGNRIGSVSEETGQLSIPDMEWHGILHVVVIISTHQLPANSDLSGTLSISTG